MPTSKRWHDVIALIEGDGSARVVVVAAGTAAQAALESAAADPVFAEALWLLVRPPLAARDPRSADGLPEVPRVPGRFPSLLELTAGLTETLDAFAVEIGGKTDFGEMAQLSLIETFSDAIEPQLPSLFEAESSDVRAALGRLSRGDRFAGLSRSFFARLKRELTRAQIERGILKKCRARRRDGQPVTYRFVDGGEALAPIGPRSMPNAVSGPFA